MICKGGYVCKKFCYFNLLCGDCMEMVNVIILLCEYSIEIYCYVELVIVMCKRFCERLWVCGYLC